MGFLRNEELVYINNRQISKNGFKNLVFGTTKIASPLTPLRGFGTTLSESNLSVIDTIDLEFIIDADELSEIALMYVSFKTIGALPLKNKYIVEKLKDSYLEKSSIVDFKKEKKVKEVDSIIVYLENIKITSLEQTDNGYSVYMKLVLDNRCFSKIENLNYKSYYNEWKQDNDFENICFKHINEELNNIKSNDYPLSIELINLEKLNASLKGNVFLNGIKKDNVDDDDVKKLEKRLRLLKKFEPLEEHTKLTINGINIVQVELITNNTISTVPIVGQNLPKRSVMGVSQSFYNIKCVFDESDNKKLNQLKMLSDKNLLNHKIQLSHPLMNMFDFYGGSIKNIVFNNIESFNGVMVTIQFQIDGYNRNNLGLLTQNLIDRNQIKQNIIGSYLEEILSSISKIKNKATKSYSSETLHDFKDLKPLIRLFNQPIQISTSNLLGKNANFSKIYRTRFFDYLNMYNSRLLIPDIYTERDLEDYTDIDYNEKQELELSKFLKIYTASGKIWKDSYSEYLLDKIKRCNILAESFFDNKDRKVKNINSDQTETEMQKRIQKGIWKDVLGSDFKNKNFKSRELIYPKVASFYNYCDMIGLLIVYNDTENKKEIDKQLNSNRCLKTLNEKLFDPLFELIYSEKFTIKNTLELKIRMITMRELFIKAFTIFNTGVFSTLTKELISLDTTFESNNIINFKEIYKYIDKYLDEYKDALSKTMLDSVFRERILNEVINMENIYKREDLDDKDLINNMIINYMDDLIIEYESIFNETLKIAKEFSYNVCLTKLITIFTSDYVIGTWKGKGTMGSSCNELIKAVIISSCLTGFLSIKDLGRTDSFGNIFKLTSNQLSETLSNYFGMCNEYSKSNKEAIKQPFFIKYYEDLKNTNNKSTSYYDTKIDLEKLLPDNKNNAVHFEAHKDYNFIYKHSIKTSFPELMIDKSIIDDNENESIQNCEDIIKTSRENFDKSNDKNTDALDYMIKKTNKIDYMPSLSPIMYTKDKDEKRKISQVMKKRIIGYKDVFKDFEKISNIINVSPTTTMPNYDIVIRLNNYSGLSDGSSKIINSKLIANLNNLVDVSISKNSTKKIKTATLTFADINKELIQYSNDNQLGLINKTDEKLELLHIQTGADIEVYLGYSDKKDLVFKGYIQTINYQGNIINFTCSDAASLLYNYHIPELKLRANSDKENSTFNLSNLWFHMIYSKQSQNNNKNLFENATSLYLNNHLFNFHTEQMPDDTNASYFHLEKQYVSAYNVFFATMIRMPYLSLSYFDANNYIGKNNLLTEHIKASAELNRLFGDFGSNKSTAYDYAVSSSVFNGLNNIDLDYETYGLRVNFEQAKKIPLNEKEQKEKFIKEVQIDKNVEIDRTLSNIIVNPHNNFMPPTSSVAVTSIFGELRKGINGKYRQHKGVDIVPIANIPSNSKLYTIADSEVVAYSTTGARGYGNFIKFKILVKDGNNKQNTICYTYAHMETIALSKLQLMGNVKIPKGTYVGIIGATGGNFGKHLHLEVSINGKYVDPFSIILNPKSYTFLFDQIGQTSRASNNEIAKAYIRNYKRHIEELQKDTVVDKTEFGEPVMVSNKNKKVKQNGNNVKKV